MRCISRKFCIGILIFSSIVLGGCGSSSYAIPYTPDSSVSSYRVVDVTNQGQTAETFASDICVVEGNLTDDEEIDMSQATGAALFDINGSETLYAKNVYEQLYPASLTKIMTALVALKNGSSDMVLTASENVYISESGAQLCGIKQGDQMTLDQALHVLLINSANDAAILIAEGIGNGSVDNFVEMMNEEAIAIGATNSHFANPHGLSDDSHYTTVYDMYLILNEAIKYDLFNEIIQMSSYDTVYYDKNGKSKELSVGSTNLFLQGVHTVPAGVTILGGKTGTTNAAGHCLAIVAKDTSGSPYISIVLRSESRDLVYQETSDLLEKIAK